ncbi:MAG: phosphatase PAP2 family protein [Anaerolineaceae bacterium]|nr:phosphatase PAP2 family protein [Anaerolineaceae bacterium]
MGIDIQYLLFLQGIRNATGGFFNEFFNAISKFAVDILPFLPFIIFWSVNKKWGYRFLFTHYVSDVLNSVIKLTVCAYRPWIRSDQVEPAGDSKVAATGYSFPSGHTVVATSNYGTSYVAQKKQRKWLAVLCAVLILLTGFSRNFLGVHTPQDVIVGFLEACLVIWIVGKVQDKVSGNDKLLDRLTLAGFVAIILVIVYVKFKPYPMDYVDGKLLVDPQAMMNDLFKACGAICGLLIGSYVDRHYIHYEIPQGSSNLSLLTWIGFAILFSWKTLFAPATIVAWFGGHWGNFIARFIMLLFGMICWPLVIRKHCGDTAAVVNKK